MGEKKNSPLVEIDTRSLADEIGEATTNTLDGGKSVHNLSATINVGVEDTQDVLEITRSNEKGLNFSKGKCIPISN